MGGDDRERDFARRQNRQRGRRTCTPARSVAQRDGGRVDVGIGKNAAHRLVQDGVIPGIRLNGMKVRRRVLEEWMEDMEGMDLSDPKNPVPLAMGGK